MKGHPCQHGSPLQGRWCCGLRPPPRAPPPGGGQALQETSWPLAGGSGVQGGQEETPNAAEPPQGWQGAAGTGEGCAAQCPVLQPSPVLVRCQRDIPTCQRTPPSPFPPHPASPPPPASKRCAQEREWRQTGSRARDSPWTLIRGAEPCPGEAVEATEVAVAAAGTQPAFLPLLLLDMAEEASSSNLCSREREKLRDLLEVRPSRHQILKNPFSSPPWNKETPSLQPFFPILAPSPCPQRAHPPFPELLVPGARVEDARCPSPSIPG